MSDPFSSEDGIDEEVGEGDIPECESLEDRIYNTRRPPSDEETRVSVRLERWQHSQVDMLTGELNTSKSEVTAKAYVHGLGIVRERLNSTDVEELGDMRSTLQRLTLEEGLDYQRAHTIQQELDEHEVDIETKPQGNVGRQFNIPIPESVASEVTNKYIDKLNLNGGFHRVILSAGLSDSENATRTCTESTELMVTSLEEGVEKSRQFLEQKAADYISSMSYHWMSGESDKEIIELVKEMAGCMKTENGDIVSHHLELIESSEAHNKEQ